MKVDDLDCSWRPALVDSDPQGNLTSYLVAEDVVDDLLDNSDGQKGNTLWSALKPIVEGSGELREITPIPLANEIELLAGDIRLAEFEAELNTLWGECFQRKIRGFRGTAALSALVNAISSSRKSSIVLYDTGPNIGALNRAILLDCDYFVVPAACDLFSLRAIKTLGHTLVEWVNSLKMLDGIAPDRLYFLPGEPKLLGYVAQRFRVYASEVARNYAQFLPRIEKSVKEDLIVVLERVDAALTAEVMSPLRLGQIQDFGSLANGAQREGRAIWSTESGTQGQRDIAQADFHELAKVIATGMHLVKATAES